MIIFLLDIERLQPSFIQIAFYKNLHQKIESCWFYVRDKNKRTKQTKNQQLLGEDAFLICHSRIYFFLMYGLMIVISSV